jgi:hypothetical protein
VARAAREADPQPEPGSSEAAATQALAEEVGQLVESYMGRIRMFCTGRRERHFAELLSRCAERARCLPRDACLGLGLVLGFGFWI